MTSDGFVFTQTFFTQFWRFYTCFYIPGTNLTPAALSIGIIVLVFGIKFIRRISSAMLSTGGSE